VQTLPIAQLAAAAMDDLRAAQALAEQPDREQHGEEDLELEHERREPRRHPLVHRDEQEAELARADRGPDGDHPAPVRAGAPDEEDRREDHEREAQGDEEQRRERLERDVQDDEIQAPDEGDREGEQGVAGRHRLQHAERESSERLDFLCSIHKDRCMIDVRRLRALREVADRGTIAAAADALHLTPSAVSQQLAALAGDAGTPVVEREGRGVRLTPAAAVLLRHADALLAQVERLDVDLDAHRRGELGELRVAGFATSLRGLVAPAAARLRETAPGVRLRICEADTTSTSSSPSSRRAHRSPATRATTGSSCSPTSSTRPCPTRTRSPTPPRSSSAGSPWIPGCSPRSAGRATRWCRPPAAARGSARWPRIGPATGRPRSRSSAWGSASGWCRVSRRSRRRPGW
jgi:molybdenum-dependent DNA-binding transcriptional regulator ModE